MPDHRLPAIRQAAQWQLLGFWVPSKNERMGDTDMDTDTEGVSDFPDDGKAQAELDEALRLAQEEKDYETRMRHLRKRMARSTLEYEELKKKIADMKARLGTPLADPRICPQPPPVPPVPLKRRRRHQRPLLMGEGEEEEMDENAGGDGFRTF